MIERQTVSIPVEAKLGPIRLGLFPEREESSGGSHLVEPDYSYLPWAWCAMIRVTFIFGDRVTTKRITHKVCWPVGCEPTPTAIATRRGDVMAGLAAEIGKHGLTLPPDHPVIETRP